MHTILFPGRGSSALRRGRWSQPGGTYFVTFATHRRAALFTDWALACTVARMTADSSLWRGSILLCWVLMPDHWHGLIQLADSESLSTLVGRLKAVTARAVNQQRRCSARVWAQGFHDHALRSDEDHLAVARYIIANPVRAGLCVRVGHYPFWDAVWLD
jgi:REP element-mobilizing transposase RayT